MLDQLVEHLKSATASEQPEATIKTLLTVFVEQPEQAKSAMPDFDQDEAILYEDDQISIWYCRFQPGASVPPHNHNMSAVIGVFHGTERNDMYERGDKDILKPLKSTDIHAGEVLSIAPDAIHGVTCTSAKPSEAIHVYLGALSRVDRDLYDMEHGTVLAFTDENYSQLTQDKN